MCNEKDEEWLQSPKLQLIADLQEYLLEPSHQYCLLGGETVQQAEANHSGHLHQALHVPALQVQYSLFCILYFDGQV